MKTVLSGLMLLAHSWYPWACCHDQHCHPVPCETIKGAFWAQSAAELC